MQNSPRWSTTRSEATSLGGRATSRIASVSNLADREHLDTTQPLFSLMNRGDALPEELKTRSGWSLITEPQLSQLMTAIIEDNYNRMQEFLPQLRQLIARLSGFKIELNTRSGVMIACRNMFLGHMLCLCASPRVLQFLQTHDILSPSLFAKKVNLCIDFEPQSKLPEDSVFALEQRRFNWRSVPSFFMVTLRDSFDSFEWLVRHGFLRKLTDTDEDGRNILHASIELESPFVLTNLLAKDCLSQTVLQSLFRQQERTGRKLTPMVKACYAEGTAMLFVLLQSLPKQFLVGELDSSGRSENLICAVISHVKDPAVATELVTFLLQRGATPDTAYFDKRSCLEVLINSEHFSGHDLCHLVQRLINASAKVDLSVMITCLSCTFRTDQEILEITCELLTASGASVLSDPHQSEMKELGEESLDMEMNVVVQMLRNPQIQPATVRALLKHFSRHVNISSIFPSVQQLSMALIQGVRAELKLSPVATDNSAQRATLNPASLGLVLESLSSFAASASSDSIRRQRYKDSLFHGIMHHLFRETDFTQSLLPKEKLSRLLPDYLTVIEEAQLDLNAVVDGKVSMFAAFEPTCPGWLSLSLLRKIPASFRLNIRDKKCHNLAVVLMRTFDKRYKMLLVALKTLKSKGFNMSCQVMGRYTLLMAFVEICGSGLKALEASGALEEERVRQFMEVFNFLLDEGIDPNHSFTHRDENDREVTISVLSLALSLGVSILVLDLIRRHPAVLLRVSSSTVLDSIQKFPELLEMLNSKTSCQGHDHHHDSLDNTEHSVPANGLAHGHSHGHGNHDNMGFENGLQEGHNSRDSVIQHHWHEYVQRHHIGLLKLAIDDEDSLATLVLVYDYFQTCEIVSQPVDTEADTGAEGLQAAGEGKSKRNKKTAVKKKRKQKLLVEAVRMEHGIFREPEGEPDRMNSRLLRVMAGNSKMKSHPMVTEYLQRFYVGSFFMAVFMNLFHFVYLVLLVGHLSWVTTNPKSEASHFSGFHLLRSPESYRVTGYFNCPYAKCPDSNFFAHRSSNCESFNISCEICTGRLLDSAQCLVGSKPEFTRCPVYDWDRGWFWITPAQYVLLAISGLSVVKEIHQAATNHRVYFKNWLQNLVETTMYALIFLSCINVSECPWSSGFRENWQWTVSVFAAFLAWCMMFFYLSRFQVFSTYVMMFYTSVKTGIGVLISFLCFIMAFVQVFHMLLYNQYNFRNFWVSFFKVFDMMTGGLDYNDIFSSAYNKDEGKLNLVDQKLVYDDVLTRLVYVFFIVAMPIVLMNLFIGLIVGDVQQINADAEVKTWTNCVSFIDMTYAMLRWRSVLQRKFKKRRQHQQQRQHPATAERGGASMSSSDMERMDIRNIRLDSIGKHTVTATLLGLVSGRELSRRLLASEKRKLRVKALARSLHNRLPFLYNTYDLNSESRGTDHFDLAAMTEAAEAHHHHRHVCSDKDVDPLRRLAVPEDVKFDDPFLRQRRETLIFPNRLNRLRASNTLDSEDSETGL